MTYVRLILVQLIQCQTYGHVDTYTTGHSCPIIVKNREREMFYLTTHSTHFIYGYLSSDIWLRTILIVRKETRCRHIAYSYRLTARVLLYAPSIRQDNTHQSLCYTSRGALAGTRNSSIKHNYSCDSASSSWGRRHQVDSAGCYGNQ